MALDECLRRFRAATHPFGGHFNVLLYLQWYPVTAHARRHTGVLLIPSEFRIYFFSSRRDNVESCAHNTVRSAELQAPRRIVRVAFQIFRSKAVRTTRYGFTEYVAPCLEMWISAVHFFSVNLPINFLLTLNRKKKCRTF